MNDIVMEKILNGADVKTTLTESIDDGELNDIKNVVWDLVNQPELSGKVCTIASFIDVKVEPYGAGFKVTYQFRPQGMELLSQIIESKLTHDLGWEKIDSDEMSATKKIDYYR